MFLGLNHSDIKLVHSSASRLKVGFCFEENIPAKFSPEVEVICLRYKISLKRQKIDLFPNLKMICAMSTGMDNIDLGYCSNRGIKVVNLPAYGSCTVAEYAFALALTLSKKIIQSRVKQPGSKDYTTIQGIDLFGKKVAILGTGKIGTHIARIANGFGMQIFGFDKFLNEDLTIKYGLVYKNLEELIGLGDFIFLSLPLNEESYHLIDQRILLNIRKDAFIINIGRGELIDTYALLNSLIEGRVAGAALDVLEEEKSIFATTEVENKEIYALNRKLLKLENVIITPHNAFNTVESVGRIIRNTVESVSQFYDQSKKT